MKKTLIFLAAAVLGSAISCQKEVEPQGENGVRVTVIASADSKTALVEGGTTSSFKWTGTENDQVFLYENGTLGTDATIDLSENDTKAAISATFEGTATEYVYTGLITKNRTGSGNATLPMIQYPSATNFDPTADVLIGKPTTAVTERPTSGIAMQFGRAVAVSKMHLTDFEGENEKVIKVEFIASNTIAGYVSPNYELGVASYVTEGSGTSKTITLDYTASGVALTDDAFNVYFLAWAVNTGDFTVNVVTDQYEYSKAISGKSLTFKLDKLVSFNFTLSDAEKKPVETSKTFTLVTSVSDLSIGAEVMILNASGDTRYALGKTQNSNNRSAQTVTVTGNTVKSVTGCEIFTLGEGTKDNTYSFFATLSDPQGYIYAASSGSNYLRTQDTNDDNGSFAVSISNDGVASITAQGTNTRNKLKCNPGNNPPIFSCYGSGMTDVAIYQYDSRIAPTVTSTSKSITTLQSQDVSEMFSSNSDGEVTYTVSGGTLTGTIFTADAAGEYTVSFNQAATDTYKAASKDEKITVTAAPSLEATEIEATGDNTNKTITVEWVDVANATAYTVHCNAKSYEVAAGVGTYTIPASELDYSVEYTIYVTASATGYYPSNSNEETITLTDPTKQDLESPVISSASAIGTTVTITWTDVDNATNYYVECGSQSQNVDSGVQSAQFTATAGAYNVYVTAQATGYNDGKSEVAEVEVYEQFATPADFAAGTVTNNSIPVTWSAVTGATAGYEVSKDNTNWNDVSGTSYTFEGLEASTTYDLYVRVKASGYYKASEPAHIQAKTVSAVKTYHHTFSTKPDTGNNVTLSTMNWNITATALNAYNSGYAGVQFGTSKATGNITLTSSAAWNYQSTTKVKEIRVWLNTGGGTITPTVTIGGTSITSDGTTVTKKSSLNGDYTKANKVTFKPSSSMTGVIIISVEKTPASGGAGYICAIEVDSE